MKAIGKVIKRVVEKKGVKSAWLADELNMSRNNLYLIYQKETIDTRLLERFSEVLQHDFTQYLVKPKGSMAVEEPPMQYGRPAVPSVVFRIYGDDAGIVDDAFMDDLHDYFQRHYLEALEVKKRAARAGA